MIRSSHAVSDQALTHLRWLLWLVAALCLTTAQACKNKTTAKTNPNARTKTPERRTAKPADARPVARRLVVVPCPETKGSPTCDEWDKCYQRDGDACHAVAQRYLGGNFVKTDQKRATTLLKLGCQFKSGAACLRYGMLLEREKGQRQQAISYFRKACRDYLWGPACTHIGVMHEIGHKGFERSEEKAFRYLKKACGLKEASACTRIGLYLKEGRPEIKKDITKARIYLEKGCRLKDPNACAQLGEALVLDKKAGRGRYKKALPHIKKSCKDGDVLGCTWLAVYQLKGWARVPRKPRAAVAKLRKACKQRQSHGCYFLAQALIGGAVKRNFKQGLKALKEACLLTYLDACLRLISIYKRGKGIKKNAKLANSYQHMACSAAHYPSCFALGRSSKKGGDNDSARRFFFQACRGGLKAACAALKKLPKPKDSQVIQPSKLPKTPPRMPPPKEPRPAPRR